MKCIVGCFGNWKHGKTIKGCPQPKHRHSSTNGEVVEAVKFLKAKSLEKQEPNEKAGGNKEQLESSSATENVCKTNKNGLTNSENDLEQNEREEKEMNRGKDSKDCSNTSQVSSYAPQLSSQKNSSSSVEEELNANHLEESWNMHFSQEDESSESLFSLSIDSMKPVFAAEIGDKEVNSPLKPRTTVDNGSSSDDSNRRHSVLKPVENLIQLRLVKPKTEDLVLKHEDKENFKLGEKFIIPLIEDEPLLNQLKRVSDQPKSNAVDTSLSSWLVEFEKSITTTGSSASVGNSLERTDSRKNSPISVSKLDIEKLNEPTCVETTPTVGSVGTYWRRIGLVVDSGSDSSCREKMSNASTTSRSCREGKHNYQLVPFQVRLEFPADSGAAQV